MQAMTLQEMQAAQFDVLKRVDAICREQGIKYYIGFGTLLGAVRHRGFIPWDDDIDLLLMREDYNRLADYFRSGADVKGLRYDSVATRKNYPHYIARISETSTKWSGDSYQTGAFIDLYPLDIVKEQWLDSWQRVCIKALTYGRNTILPELERLPLWKRVFALSLIKADNRLRRAIRHFSVKKSYQIHS